MTTPTPDPRDPAIVDLTEQARKRGRALGQPRREEPAQGRRKTGSRLHPAAGSARAVTSVLRYWRAERRTLRQGMIALSISAAGNIPTGLALGAMTGRLEALPGLIVMVPAAIGMRGAIFGALGSRLGTRLSAGLLTFTTERTGALYQNVYASVILTLSTSLYIAVGARALSLSLGRSTVSVWDLIVISVLGSIASSIVVLAVTIWVAWMGARRGWDLDSVAAPLITFVGDLITMPALFAASFVAAHGSVTLAVGIACALLCVVAAVQIVRTRAPIARRILRESALTLAVAGVVDLLAGLVVGAHEDRFVRQLPVLLVMLPSFLENAGALGGVVSSRLASKLHLGSIQPRLWPERLAALDISLAGPWSILNFAFTGATAHLVAVALGRSSPGLLVMIGLALLAGAMATVGAAVVAYATAVATFRFNLDPDNHGIAAVTSTMDLVSVLCITAAVAILGVR